MIHPDELREKFRTFFLRRNHKEIPSSSLIPSSDDPTVLFTTAGMQPLVPYLLGASHPKGKRLFDTQKCFRTPDIDEVGDDTHHTFFEMLGNWSLGDYFKKEAIDLAYDFFVKELGLDPKRFAITIFKGDSDAPKDEEAKALWLAKEGIEEHQIYEFGKADNFWGPAGATGPCGPCSEIHYDRGEKYGEDLGPNCDDNQRYVEIWNLVFMEYEKKADGTYEKLSQKNVDTGVGFERLLAVLNEKDSAFDTPLFENILKKIEELSGKKYAENKRAFRIIADHIRGATFAIADGVTPGNEGRNYVLRRIIRRAVREGRRIGIADAFSAKVADVVIRDYREHYPELEEHKNTIFSVLQIEEENFRKTLDRGEKILEECITNKGSISQISGKDAFLLFDTYGFPLDLTKDFAAEHGITVDEEGFYKEMQAQQERSRAAGKFERGQAVQHFAHLPQTTFVGYTKNECEAEVLGVLEENEETYVVLDKTPFYAESGGQVGDSGIIMGKNGKIEVKDCQKTAGGVFLHRGKKTGKISEGEKVVAKIDANRRGQIMRHHSLAHLFPGAAQKVLGKDVHQAGSHVNEHRTRFDFTFPRALQKEEIQNIENNIAQAVNAAVDVVTQETALEEAKKSGVEATFGEKYGETVRTVRMGEYSYELCGGTHVRNTAEVGAVKILSETGVSAGVRRVEIVCGMAAQKLLQEKYEALETIAKTLKVPTGDIALRLEKIFAEHKEMHNDICMMQKKLADFEAKEYAQRAKDIAGQKTALVLDFSGDGKAAGALARAIIAHNVAIAIVLTTNGNIAIATNGEKNAKAILQNLNAAFGGGGGGGNTFASGGGLRGISEKKLVSCLCEGGY